MKILLRLVEIIFYAIIILLFASCSSTRTANYKFNQKYPADKLKEDAVLLKKIIEANHPSLYWYTTKDSLDYYFNTAINSITDSLTEMQFRNKVAYVISKIHCGHTSVRYSKQYTNLAAKHLFPAFPLSIKTWGDSMVVLNNVFAKESALKPGTVMTAINGLNTKAFTDSFFQFISTDGYATNYKSQVVSGNFGGWYKNVVGLKPSYNIEYIDSAGNKQTAVLKNFSPKKDSAVKKKDSAIAVTAPAIKPTRIPRLVQKRDLSVDTAGSTAYMRLTTFGRAKLKKFFRQSFRSLSKNKTKNLIIDLRENGGGNVDNFVKLTQYLKDTAFKTGDSVMAITRKLQYSKYIHPGIVQWFNLNFFTTKMGDGRYHQQRTEQHYYEPQKKHHFNGKVYIITGGYTYSAASMLAGALKGQKNITLIGEETGGGYYGNTAMQIPEIILPASHLRVRLPLFRVVIDSTRAKDGRGILPDIAVPPASNAIKNGIDIKMSTIKKLITGNIKA